MATKAEMIADGDVVQKRTGNRLVLTSYTPLITTEQELFDFCEIDRDEWIIQKLTPNAWTTPSKDVEKDLVFEAGASTGFVRQSNNMRFAQNIQVKMVLVRKIPEALNPMIQPIQYYGGEFKKPQAPAGDLFRRHFIWGDPQFGFRRRVHDAKLTELHDRRALDVVAQIAAYCGADQIDVLGDWFDMAEFGKYLLSPEFYYTLQPAIYESFFWLEQLASVCPDVRIHEGNHDKRLPDAIKRYMPFAYGLRPADLEMSEAPAVLSVRNLMALDSLGVKWIDKYPNDGDWLAEDLILNHGIIARQGPIETAIAVARGRVSEIYGHIHKRQYSVGQHPVPEGAEIEVVAFSPGCTCHIDYRVPGHNRNQEWSQGCAVVDVFNSDDGRGSQNFSITPIAINNGAGVYDGRRFVARGRLDELRSRQPDWNW